MNRSQPTGGGAALALLAALLLADGPLVGQEAPPEAAAPAEALEGGEGRLVPGHIVGDVATGFRFAPEAGGEPMRLAPGAVVRFNGEGPEASTARPPFRVRLGPDGRISGRLGTVTEDRVHLEDGPGGAPVTIERRGVRALLQRPGEAQVFREAFEALDGPWSEVGSPEIVPHRSADGVGALRLPADGSAMTYVLPEPVGSGRLEVAVFDDGRRVRGRRWFVDLTFRGAEADRETVRAVLGWTEESLAVESLGGPPLAVQRLARRGGWHRLAVRFGPEQTDLAVDGFELAHGDGPGGPLVEVRLATEPDRAGGPPPGGLAARLDDLSLVRFAEPTGRLASEPGADEVRLTGGDQLFGTVRSADADAVVAEVAGRAVRLPWSEVAGLQFRRAPAVSAPVAGLLVRLSWRSAPGAEDDGLDAAEGALKGLDGQALRLDVPFVGELAVPRDRLRRLEVRGRARRIVVDPSSYHLGNRYDEDLDPPQPEGGTLEIAFDLPAVPEGRPSLVLDVVGLIGERGNPDFSAEVRRGFLRTHARLNGAALDDLNPHVASTSEAAERIALPIPDGALKAGRNILRLEQVGMETEPEMLDNFGLLGVALEFDLPEDPSGPRP